MSVNGRRTARRKIGPLPCVHGDMNWTTTCLLALVGIGCATGPQTVAVRRTHTAPSAAWPESTTTVSYTRPVELPSAAAVATPQSVWADPRATMVAAAERASPGGRRVLDTARTMIDEETVVRGSCYGWVNAVYRRAGGRSRVAFQGHRRTRFAEAAQVQPGDWVFFINHSFGDVTHSAIFVAWIDERARTALMVSYPGQNRDAPGRYGEYELSNVYQLVRMGDS